MFANFDFFRSKPFGSLTSPVQQNKPRSKNYPFPAGGSSNLGNHLMRKHFDMEDRVKDGERYWGDRQHKRKRERKMERESKREKKLRKKDTG